MIRSRWSRRINPERSNSSIVVDERDIEEDIKDSVDLSEVAEGLRNRANLLRHGSITPPIPGSVNPSTSTTLTLSSARRTHEGASGRRFVFGNRLQPETTPRPIRENIPTLDLNPTFARQSFESRLEQQSPPTSPHHRVFMRNLVKAVIKENSRLEIYISDLERRLKEKENQIDSLKRALQRREQSLEARMNQLKTMRIITKAASPGSVVAPASSSSSAAYEDTHITKKDRRMVAALAMFESFRMQAGKYKRQQQRIMQQRRRQNRMQS